jgi:hypothetical protein
VHRFQKRALRTSLLFLPWLLFTAEIRPAFCFLFLLSVCGTTTPRRTATKSTLFFRFFHFYVAFFFFKSSCFSCNLD